VLALDAASKTSSTNDYSVLLTAGTDGVRYYVIDVVRGRWELPQLREQLGKFRTRTSKPINANFFCHTPAVLNNAREAQWRDRLAPYYRELAIEPAAPLPSTNRTACEAAMCEVLEETKPEVVSFLFGLPDEQLMARVHGIERGRDLRAYPLFAFGGAGPVHAWHVGHILKVPRVLVPFGAGAISTTNVSLPKLRSHCRLPVRRPNRSRRNS